MNIAVSKKRTRPGKKPEIVALATEAFSELGYSAASLRDIGQRAGVTAASLYHHFESKEDLLRFIVDDGCSRLAAALRAELESPAEPRARLERLVRAHIRFIVDNRHVTKIILEEANFLGEAGAASVREQQYAILDIYRGCLAELRAAGELKDDGLTATAFLVISVVNGFNRWFRPNGPMKLEEAIDRAAGFVMAGLDAA
jgi:TetR/AcrR family transcriptional regulator, cholesterol catabolism regulator